MHWLSWHWGLRGAPPWAVARALGGLVPAGERHREGLNHAAADLVEPSILQEVVGGLDTPFDRDDLWRVER